MLILCIIKIFIYRFGLEKLAVNQLFSAMVASTVFLLGFLLSGVLTDFKESEKIPGEIATSLESLFLEIKAIPAYHPDVDVSRTLDGIAILGEGILGWFNELIDTEILMSCYIDIHASVVDAAVLFKGDASTLRGRLMQDLAVVLQKINRVQTVRETSFVPLVYWMANTASVLLFAGLVMAKSDNLAESVFFLAVISFLVILLLRLIDDIDNPFGFSDPTSAEDVSIDVLQSTVKRIRNSLAG